MRRNLIARHEELLIHIEEIIGIIQNDCQIMLDEKGYSKISIYQVGVAHVQGLCNGLKKRIEGFDNEP